MKNRYDDFINNFVRIIALLKKAKNQEEWLLFKNDYVVFLNKYIPLETDWKDILIEEKTRMDRYPRLKGKIGDMVFEAEPIRDFFYSELFYAIAEKTKVGLKIPNLPNVTNKERLKELIEMWSIAAKAVIHEGYSFEKMRNRSLDDEISKFQEKILILAEENKCSKPDDELQSETDLFYQKKLHREFADIVPFYEFQALRRLPFLIEMSRLCGYDFENRLKRDDFVDQLKKRTARIEKNRDSSIGF